MSHSCGLQFGNLNYSALQPLATLYLLGASEGVVEVKERTLSRELEGGRCFFKSQQEMVLSSRVREEAHTTEWGDPAQSFTWGWGACWWPVGRVGAWRSFPGRSSVTGLPPPHPRRGSRWPNYREGVGRPSRGRGMGEEIEQAKGGWGVGLARRLFNE